ncbi:MAG: hypothetical protein AAB582_03400 [Patescibacteria group bacterium]
MLRTLYAALLALFISFAVGAPAHAKTSNAVLLDCMNRTLASLGITAEQAKTDPRLWEGREVDIRGFKYVLEPSGASVWRGCKKREQAIAAGTFRPDTHVLATPWTLPKPPSVVAKTAPIIEKAPVVKPAAPVTKPAQPVVADRPQQQAAAPAIAAPLSALPQEKVVDVPPAKPATPVAPPEPTPVYGTERGLTSVGESIASWWRENPSLKIGLSIIAVLTLCAASYGAWIVSANRPLTEEEKASNQRVTDAIRAQQRPLHPFQAQSWQHDDHEDGYAPLPEPAHSNDENPNLLPRFHGDEEEGPAQAELGPPAMEWHGPPPANVGGTSPIVQRLMDRNNAQRALMNNRRKRP